MDNKDLLKKDFQLLTSHTLISILAYQRTIIENQAFIIYKLTNIPHEEVVSKTDEYLNENREKVIEMIDKNILSYLDVEKIRY